VKGGLLRATYDYEKIKSSNVAIVTVQTPISRDKKPDLRAIKEACGKVGENLRENTLVCIESTVPPYTMEKVIRPILEEASGHQVGTGFNLVYCYERVTPGHLIENLSNLPRVVGGITKECTRRGVDFYNSFCMAQALGTDALTAEVSKLIENSNRDVNIAFANEAACICQSLGVDFFEVRKLVNSLPYREGKSNPIRNILEPGAGVGGHCLPKDPYLLISESRKRGYDAQLIPMARSINEKMPELMYEMVVDALSAQGRAIQGSRIGILGLSYKEDTDDPRNSPTIELVKLLGAPVRIHDPYITHHGRISTLSLLDTILGSDCLVVMTKHSQYRELELGCIAQMMRTKTIVDGRNLFDPDECVKKGFVYRGVGHAAYKTS